MVGGFINDKEARHECRRAKLLFMLAAAAFTALKALQLVCLEQTCSAEQLLRQSSAKVGLFAQQIRRPERPKF